MTTERLCIIFNPAAGKNRAQERLGQGKKNWTGEVVFLPTEGPGHAIHLAREAASQGFDIVAAAGGDGTVHEVVNGLMLAGSTQARLGLIPVGSANDYAFSVGVHQPNGPKRRRVDVGVATTSAGRRRFFACCLGLGLNGFVTLESRRIRWLQGLPLYGWASLRAICRHFQVAELGFRFDDSQVEQRSTLMFSLLIGQREGNFVLGPDAVIDDGLFDVLHVGPLSRSRVLTLLPRVALFGLPNSHPAIRQSRCKSALITLDRPLPVHVDGEMFLYPEDGCQEIRVELIPSALEVQWGFY